MQDFRAVARKSKIAEFQCNLLRVVAMVDPNGHCSQGDLNGDADRGAGLMHEHERDWEGEVTTTVRGRCEEPLVVERQRNGPGACFSRRPAQRGPCPEMVKMFDLSEFKHAHVARKRPCSLR